MKILHIFDHSIPLHSGYTFRSRSIIREQNKLDWQTIHLTSSKQGAVEGLTEVVDKLLFYRSDELTGWQKKIPMLNQWFVINKLEKRLKEVIILTKPDIIHAHSPALNGIAAVKMGKLFAIPVVYEIRGFWEDAAVDHGTSREHGLRYKLTRALETYVIKRADAVTTICEGLRTDIIARGISQEKITVVANAVDIEKFSASQDKDSELERKYTLNEQLVIGFIGSFYAYEGLLLLLDAVPEMLKKIKNLKILLVGGGSEEQALKERVIKLGIEKQVVFTGRVAHDIVQKYYDLIDILVYPRLSMRLTELVTPLKPLEAMAQKKLFVASDVGGHKELIRHKFNGLLFKSGSSSELAKTVLQLAGEQQIWPQLKDNGRNYVETERNWTVSVGCYKSIYQSLAGNDKQC